MASIDQTIQNLRARLPALIDEHIAAPSNTLREIVEGVDRELNALGAADRRPNNIVHYLAEHPQELAALEGLVGPGRKFGFQDVGDRAMVLTYEDANGHRMVLRMTQHAEITPPNAPSILPAERTEFRGISMAVSQPALPLDKLVDEGVISKAEAEAINKRMSVETARDGMVYTDAHTGNVGIAADGSVKIIDPGAVNTEAAERLRLPEHFHDTPDMAQHFLDGIDKNKALAAATPSLNAGIEPHPIEAGILGTAHVPPVVVTEPHVGVPTEPHIGTPVKPGVLGAAGNLIMPIVVAGATLIATGNLANAAEAGVKTAVPIDSLTAAKTPVDTTLAAGNVVTGAIVTGGAVTTIGAGTVATVATGVGATELATGALAVAGTATGVTEVAAIGATAISILQDVAYAAGYTKNPGLIGSIAQGTKAANDVTMAGFQIQAALEPLSAVAHSLMKSGALKGVGISDAFSDAVFNFSSLRLKAEGDNLQNGANFTHELAAALRAQSPVGDAVRKAMADQMKKAGTDPEHFASALDQYSSTLTELAKTENSTVGSMAERTKLRLEAAKRLNEELNGKSTAPADAPQQEGTPDPMAGVTPSKKNTARMKIDHPAVVAGNDKVEKKEPTNQDNKPTKVAVANTGRAAGPV